MQLEISLILSQILAFLIMLWVLKKWAWKPLLTTLRERREKIEGEFTSIAKQKQEAQQLKELYESKLANVEVQAKQKIDEALLFGREKAGQIQEEAQAQAKSMLQKARGDAEKEIGKAVGELKGRLVQMVMQTTEKLIGEKMDTEKDRQLIEKLIEKVHD